MKKLLHNCLHYRTIAARCKKGVALQARGETITMKDKVDEMKGPALTPKETDQETGGETAHCWKTAHQKLY